MSRTRKKSKGRSENGGFLGLPHELLNSTNFRNLSAHAVRLLIDIGSQYRGGNNGDLTAAWKIMSARGWKSRDTLNKALTELLHFGMIEKTRHGGRNRCNLFALTWRAIDDCSGKLEVASTTVASGRWKIVQLPLSKQKKNLSPPAVPTSHVWRASRGTSDVH